MKQLLVFAIIVASFSSCIGPKKYASFVSRYYKDTTTYFNNDNPQIDIQYIDSSGFTPVVKVLKGKNYCIPAIFYWAINENYKCDLNPAIPARIFGNAIYENSLELVKNLKGCKLEITINSLPRRFTYQSRTDAAIFIVAYVVMGKQYIIPDDFTVSISYKISRHGELIKKGDITGVTPAQRFVNNRSTRKRITRQYLDSYDHHIRLAAKNILHGLTETLEKIPPENAMSN
jgi:hypothetical protein